MKYNIVYRNSEDYFSRIGHMIDPEFIRTGRFSRIIGGRAIRPFLVGDTFQPSSFMEYIEDKDIIRYFSVDSALFKGTEVHGLKNIYQLVQDPYSILIFSYRHRTLIDFIYGQPFQSLIAKPNLPQLSGREAEVFHQYLNDLYLGNSKQEIALQNLETIIQKENLDIPRYMLYTDSFQIPQPILNPNTTPYPIIVTGDNLLVGGFDRRLRKFGAFSFQRKDKIYPLSKDEIRAIIEDPYKVKYFMDEKGKRKEIDEKHAENVKELIWILKHKKVGLKLPIMYYRKYVLPDYIEQQAFQGEQLTIDEIDVLIRHDSQKFPGVEYDEEGIAKVGRSKTGLLREMSSAISKQYRLLLGKYPNIEAYEVPVNISLSKYPDAFFLGPHSPTANLGRKLKYLFDLNYVFNRYPHYAEQHQEAKLYGVIRIGKPILLRAYTYEEIGTVASPELKKRIGLLETPFPANVMFKAMDGYTEVKFSTLDKRIKNMVEHYNNLGLDVSQITDARGNPKRAKELGYEVLVLMNSNPRIRNKPRSYSKKIVSMTKTHFITHNQPIRQWYANGLQHLHN